jgi:hypothetical protein
MIKSFNREIIINSLIIDVALISILFVLPTISHILPFPIYLLDPMRLVVFIGYLLYRNKLNAYFLAVFIPIFSMFTTGHPPGIKAVLIAIELLVNIVLFIHLYKTILLNPIIAIIIAILVSKVVYYSFKYSLLITGVIEGGLISTSFKFQLVVSLLLSIAVGVAFHFKTRRDGDK